MAVFALVVFIVAYLLIATERINKVKAAFGGAAVIAGAGIASADDMFYSHETGIDWNVIFLLLGMMVIVGSCVRPGVFEYTAIWASKRAGALHCGHDPARVDHRSRLGPPGQRDHCSAHRPGDAAGL